VNTPRIAAALSILGAILMLLGVLGCAATVPPGAACPRPMAPLSDKDAARLADELEAQPVGSILADRIAVEAYRLDAEARACRGEG
jgi:hypothetical protein